MGVLEPVVPESTEMIGTTTSSFGAGPGVGWRDLTGCSAAGIVASRSSGAGVFIERGLVSLRPARERSRLTARAAATTAPAIAPSFEWIRFIGRSPGS